MGKKPKVLLLYLGQPEVRSVTPEGLERMREYLKKGGVEVNIAGIDTECELGVLEKTNAELLDEKSITRFMWYYINDKRVDWIGAGENVGANPPKNILKDMGMYEKPPKLKEYDVIGISVTARQFLAWKSTQRLVNGLKKKTRVMIVAGGPGVWGNEKIAFKKIKGLDFVVTKWGEVPFLYLIKKITEQGLRGGLTRNIAKEIAKDAPRGISFRIRRPKGEVITNFEEFEEIPEEIEYYKRDKRTVLNIETSVGCGYSNCEFCWWGNCVKYREKNLKKILEKIIEAQPVNLNFTDACFFTSMKDRNKKAMWLFSEIVKEKVKGNLSRRMAIDMTARADGFRKAGKVYSNNELGKKTVKLFRVATEWLDLATDENNTKEVREEYKELFLALFENEKVGENIPVLFHLAAVAEVRIGFESGSKRVLKEFRKGCTVGDNLHTIILLGETKIPVTGFYILSSPKSTAKDVIKTFELALLNLYISSFNEISVNPMVLNYEGIPMYQKESEARLGLKPENKAALKLVDAITVAVHDDLLATEDIQEYMELDYRPTFTLRWEHLNSRRKAKKFFARIKKELGKENFRDKQYVLREINKIEKKVTTALRYMGRRIREQMKPVKGKGQPGRVDLIHPFDFYVDPAMIKLYNFLIGEITNQ